MRENKRIFYVVNVDWFFLSHRLPLALAMKEKGYEVFIVTKDTGRKQDIERHGMVFIDVDFERSGQNPMKELRIIGILIRLFRKYQPDIIHNVTIKPAIYSSIASRFYRNKPFRLINAISGLGYNFIQGRDGVVQKVLKKLMRYAYKSNVHFIFQNADDMMLYKQMGFLSRNNYKIIKGAGVDSNAFPYHEPVVKDKLQTVVTARMLFDKGIQEFISAALLLREKWNGKALFVLAGDIDEANRSGMKESDLKENIIPGYLEWIGHQKDVRPILAAADIVCLPSYREGLPKALIEAMAIGRPIVTTDVPGCRECVEQGVNGIMVPARNVADLADAIETLFTDSDLRLSMGRASREKMLRELSLDRVIKDTLDYYEMP